MGTRKGAAMLVMDNMYNYLGIFSFTVAQPYRNTIIPTMEAGISICV